MIKNILCVIALSSTLPTIQVTSKRPPETIVFVGTVERIAPDFGLSGDLAVYRLAKYKLDQVCKGEYNEREIVVDHLIVTGKELDGIKVGDQVCVSVEKSKKVLSRFNAEGIRGPKDTVRIFFVGGKVSGRDQALCCPCSQT